MRLLLDTHAFLWAATSPSRLGSACRKAMLDGGNELLLSIASAWEMAIKASLGKLRFPGSLSGLLKDGAANLGLRLLPLELGHVLRLQDLPFHHRDPFDRVLVCQALAEGLAVLSADRSFEAYGVRRIWRGGHGQ